MNVNEVLHFVDDLVFKQTGKHLNDVQKAIVEGTWQRKTYDEIGKKSNVTKNHVGDVGYKLWQLLSEQLDEEINKHNFRSTIDGLQLKSSPIIIQSNNKGNNNHNFNFGSQTIGQPNYSYQNVGKNITSQLPKYDLTLAPKIIYFYNRETELETLSNWIFDRDTRLTSVLGLSGIGKTTLVKRFIDQQLQQLTTIIWRSLKFPKSLNLLLGNLLSACDREAKESTDDRLK